MPNLEYQLFIKEYGGFINTGNNIAILNEKNGCIIITTPKNPAIGLTIDCNEEIIKYSGSIEVIFDNNKESYNYNSDIIQIGFPSFFVGLTKYFDLKTRIDICNDNIYLMKISGPEFDEINLLPDYPIDNYFKNVDIYMTDINLRRSNNIISFEKLIWYISSLNYMENAILKHNLKTKNYTFIINSLSLDPNLVRALINEVSNEITIVDYVEIIDCNFEDDAYDLFINMFRGAKISKQ